MVSMSDLVTEGDDDLMAEFFTYDETPSPVSYQQPLQHEPLKKPNMAQATNERENTTQDSTIEDTDGQGSSKLQQKLKEVDTFVQNYSVRIIIFEHPIYFFIFRVQVHRDPIQYGTKPIWYPWTI